MAEVPVCRQINFDTARIEPGQPVAATFFAASRYPYVDGSGRVTELDEKPIVRWFMLCPPVREVILEELGLPRSAFYSPEVVEPFYAKGEGDLDLVSCPRLAPHQAVALECKRVKVEAVSLGQDNLNKLQDVAKGVRQANRLYTSRLGFSQTYLAIITEAEASGQEESNIPYRGVRLETGPERGDTERATFRQIVGFPHQDKLRAGVGILFLEVAQPPGCRSTPRPRSESASTVVLHRASSCLRLVTV